MKQRTGTKVLTSLLLVLVMGLFMAMGTAAFAASGETVSYVDAQGRTQSAQATPLTADMAAWESGWYVVQGSVSIEQRITVTGTVHLILADGAKLDAKQGIETSGAELTIYGQSAGTGTLTATGAELTAGIGGGLADAGGTITVNGGAVTATGGVKGGAGIGGGTAGAGGNVTVNGGTVTATGTNGGMGIGSGYKGNGGNGTLTLGAGMYLYGGESEATAAYVHEADGAYVRSQYMQVNRDMPTALTVTYDLNGGTSEVPTDPERYTVNDPFIVLPNIPTRMGYAFTKWNTRADGSGRSYAPGETDVIRSSITLYAQWVLPYIDYVGSARVELICDDYSIVTENTTTLEDGKWYVADSNVNVNARITVSGTAHLILADGAKLDIFAGINTTGAVLNIYGQSQDTGTVNANGVGVAAGIGGLRNGDGGTIIINGGEIQAKGGRGAAGIGGGYNSAGGTITINGGTVTATGGYLAAGIGGGRDGAGGTITINGGKIQAASGDFGAGIGSGNRGAGGTITINGGTVTATSGLKGAGIGGGDRGAGGTVIINGGSVTATGGNWGAAGIGGNGVEVTINGGGVKAIGGEAVRGNLHGRGIGGNYDTDADVYCANGTLTLGEGLYLYGGGSEAEAVYVPEVDGDYRRSRYMEVNGTLRSCEVRYDLNGGTGTAPTDEKTYLAWDEVTVSPNAVARSGFDFTGWNTRADGKGTAYRPGETFHIVGNTTLYAQWAFFYLDWDGTALVEKSGNDLNRIAVTDATTELSDGKWYVVTDNVTVKDRISVNGTAHLVLCDGATLEAKQGITLAEGNQLIIHGQSGGTGALEATAEDLRYYAGIGGDIRTTGGQLTVNGGSITATGGSFGAGIGGGDLGTGGTVIVNGGTVNATGGDYGAGIGGGDLRAGGTVTVNGGTVNATGGYGAAGIGSSKGAGGTLTVNDGTVNAAGGDYGAGIGGGEESAGGTVIVNGGTVNATCGMHAAGIGGGCRRVAGTATVVDGGTLTINGGSVTANGDSDSAGISGTVTLGADVIVWAGDQANPRDTGRDVTQTFAADHHQQYVYAYRDMPPVITGADLVLDGTLKLRFYVSLPEGFSDNGASMDISVHGRTITRKLSEAEKIDGSYAFICPVYAIEMAEPVSAVFRYSDGTAEKAVSVREYLDRLEAKKDQLGLSAADTAKLTNMITAARNYGHYMQPYLAGIHNFTVGEGKDYRAMPAGSEITALTELPAFRRVWGENRYDAGVVSSIHYYDDFKESTTLNIDLGLKSHPASLTTTVDGKAWSVQALGDNSYRVSIPDIAANNLGKAFHVELTADGAVVYDAYLSALSYVSAVLDTHRDNPDEAKALTAFYQYYEAAKALE